MRSARVITAAVMAMCVIVASQHDSRAEDGPNTHPFCVLNGSGPTTCYYDSMAECHIAGGGSCIENPGYDGSREPKAHAEAKGRETRHAQAKTRAAKSRLAKQKNETVHAAAH